MCVTIAALLRKFLIRKNEGDDDDRLTPRYSILILKYLATYLLATFSDWLQGPYVYAVYDSYGLSQRDILILFVACFTSSKCTFLCCSIICVVYVLSFMSFSDFANTFSARTGLVLGSFVGALADWGGRRRVMLVYAATYTAGCATKREYVHLDKSLGVVACIAVGFVSFEFLSNTEHTYIYTHTRTRL